MTKQELRKVVTATGTARYASLLTTEKFKKEDGSMEDTGKFTTQVKFDPTETERLKGILMEEWSRFEKTIDPKKRAKMKIEPNIGIKETDDGEEYFKFSMKKDIKCRDGSIFTKSVPIFDSAKNSIADALESIGNGTKMKVAFECNPFVMTATNYGVSLRLSAIQIIELHTYGGANAESFGFEEADGFVSEVKEPASAFDEVVMAPETGEDEEGDF